jgi:hypothetical protein
MKLLALLALIGAAGVAAAQQIPQELKQPAPVLRRIEMESRTWGHLAASWSIDAQGNGRWTIPEPNPFNATQIVTRSFTAGTAGFRRIRVLIGPAEYRAGTRMTCHNPITDAVSGSVRWVQPSGRTATLSFYTGCNERSTRNVLDRLAEAQALIAEWAKAGTVVETKPVERQ